ncbi:hypothetical protein M9H77_11945 [Catharanthus roseus]|uniref:Uncharacterized protein n=1 Tax=Catharanthus roseus TaxID=4058 RepID=A0ACC0BFY4_CATRO|nr:hypothetical protein M9H77_11945 [Catharanthus roseus]
MALHHLFHTLKSVLGILLVDVELMLDLLLPNLEVLQPANHNSPKITGSPLAEFGGAPTSQSQQSENRSPRYPQPPMPLVLTLPWPTHRPLVEPLSATSFHFQSTSNGFVL